LPVCVTLSLLIIAKRMAKSRVLVKNLSTIETLGCVNVIASDKTGTLTQNRMFVASAAVGVEVINLLDHAESTKEHSVAFQQLVCISGLCNNARFEDEEVADDTVTGKKQTQLKPKKHLFHRPKFLAGKQGNKKLERKEILSSMLEINQRKATGDATDIALLKFSTEYNRTEGLNEKYAVLADIPFNSRNKWMMKIVRPVDTLTHGKLFGVDSNYDVDSDLLLLKGAPDYLLKKSTHITQPDGTSILLKTETINELIRLQNEMCIMGQRVLLLCKKACNFDKIQGSMVGEGVTLDEHVNRSNDFCVIGLVGIIDPPREGISDVIKTCRDAGIRVFMVTGDYALTAAAIAVQIGKLLVFFFLKFFNI
jgi:sodium/potassium-transporting ATPase subunit alpha